MSRIKSLMYGLAVTLSLLATSAQSAEVSIIQGVYQSENTKVNGNKALETDVISAGGRYGDFIDVDQAWFAQAGIAIRQYDAPQNAPDNSNDIAIGGGFRQYFERISETMIPYGVVGGEFRSTEEVEAGTNSFVTVERSGLFYNAGIGMRLGFGTDFFVDFEVPFFESALMGTETRKTTDAQGNETKTETSSLDLYIDTDGVFNEIEVAFGMKF